MSQKNKKPYHHKKAENHEEQETTLYEGRNAVMELLRAGRTGDKLFVAPDQNGTRGRRSDYPGSPPQAGCHE